MQKELPEFFKNMLQKQYGEEALEITTGYEEKRPITLRANTLKTNILEIIENLKNENIECETVSWNENAIIIPNGDYKKITELEIYKTGKIYLQSLSSMIPAVVLEPKAKENILDMAAAPRAEKQHKWQQFPKMKQ